MKRNNYKIIGDKVCFSGSFLSNWYPCHIKYAGKIFNSAEQLFMYIKALYFKDVKTAIKILNCNTALEAKQLGDQVKNFESKYWNQVRKEIMTIVVTEKFEQNEDLKKSLLSDEFNNKIFVEANDNIWGAGLNYSDNIAIQSNWKGLNLLGEIITKIRSKLIK